MAERQIGHRKSCLVFPRAFPSSTDVPVLLLNQPNMFTIRRFCYIDVLFQIFYYYWGCGDIICNTEDFVIQKFIKLRFHCTREKNNTWAWSIRSLVGGDMTCQLCYLGINRMSGEGGVLLVNSMYTCTTYCTWIYIIIYSNWYGYCNNPPSCNHFGRRGA